MSDRIQLRTTGRFVPASRGILGLSLTSDEGLLFHGYDGVIDALDMAFEQQRGAAFGSAPAALAGQPPLTAEERAELAGLMVERWKRWGGLP